MTGHIDSAIAQLALVVKIRHLSPGGPVAWLLIERPVLSRKSTGRNDRGRGKTRFEIECQRDDLFGIERDKGLAAGVRR